MISKLYSKIEILENSDDLISDENQNNEKHFMTARCDAENGDIYMSFSSRLAMYDFAKNLIHEAIYGENEQIECYPLGLNEKLHIVEGARLSLDSSRLFIKYATDKE